MKYLSALLQCVFLVELFVACRCLRPVTNTPDLHLDTPGLIQARGFSYEQHQVVTADGYHLTLFRIVNPYQRRPTASGRRQPRPVLLWHGIGVSSESWLFSTQARLNGSGSYLENNEVLNQCENGASNTLGFTLATCDFDVWLGNSRGTPHSIGHDQYDAATDYRYWEYTMTEMALNDIPTAVAHILVTTGETSLAYVGHSLGTDTMFALQSMMPEFGQLIQPYVALAPVAYLGNTWSAARFGVPFEPLIRRFPFPIGAPEKFMQLLGSTVCNVDGIVQICADVLYSLNGFDQANFNRTVVPNLVAHSAVSQSSWVYAQLAQNIQTGLYQMMNHGTEGNLERYNQATPPLYNISAITSPNIALYRGLNDPFSDNPDDDHLVRDLRVPLLEHYIVPYAKWNHQDFQMSSTQGFYVNTRLIQLLRRFD